MKTCLGSYLVRSNTTEWDSSFYISKELGMDSLEHSCMYSEIMRLIFLRDMIIHLLNICIFILIIIKILIRDYSLML